MHGPVHYKSDECHGEIWLGGSGVLAAINVGENDVDDDAPFELPLWLRVCHHEALQT